jgi:hypothetical protein
LVGGVRVWVVGGWRWCWGCGVAAGGVIAGSRPPRVSPEVPSASSTPDHASSHVPRGDYTLWYLGCVVVYPGGSGRRDHTTSHHLAPPTPLPSTHHPPTHGAWVGFQQERVLGFSESLAPTYRCFRHVSLLGRRVSLSNYPGCRGSSRRLPPSVLPSDCRPSRHGSGNV